MQPTLAGKSYNHLRQKLLRGDLPAGSQLVNRVLAKEIGVSMAPVREAIGRLADEGLVKQVPGAGAFVKDFSRKDLNEIYIVREAVEGTAAAEAARNISMRQIDELNEICVQWKGLLYAIRKEPSKIASSELAADWAEIDSRFHEVLVEASHNSLLQKIVQESRLLSKVFKATKDVPNLLSLRQAAWTWHDHVALVRAVEKRNPELARDLMVKQIQKGLRLVTESLKESNNKYSY